MQFTLLERMWFADFEDDEAEQKAARSLAAVAGVINGILPIPTVAAKLISMVNDPDYSSGKVADLIATDAGLSSRILRVINSPSYSLRNECKTIAHAVVLLGPKTIRETAVALSLLGLFNDKTGYGEQILEHSSLVGGLAQKLSAHSEHLKDVDVYVCALLHDIGKLLFLQADENYAEVLQGCDGPDQVHLRERDAFGFDHAVLAGHVLTHWNIPEPIPTAVAWHHKPQRAFEEGDQTAAIVAVIRIADRLAYELQNESIEMEESLQALVQDPAAEYLGLSFSDLKRVWPELVDLCQASKQELAA